MSRFAIAPETKAKILKKFPHLAKRTDKEIAHAICLVDVSFLAPLEVLALSKYRQEGQ
jgi:hypothetical protein